MKNILLMTDGAGGGGGAEASLVKIRVRKLVEELDKKTGKPNGKVRNAAQPIVLPPAWRKKFPKGTKLPERLEVGETYEVPPLLAKSLLPDVEIVG
jgi:hypothetical protein